MSVIPAFIRVAFPFRKRTTEVSEVELEEMPSTQFAFFSLPYVSATNVVFQMDAVELIAFSLSSEMAKRTVQYRKIPATNLHVKFKPNFEMSIKFDYQGKSWKLIFEKTNETENQIMKASVPTWCSKNQEILLRSNDVKTAMVMWTCYICDLFRITIETLSVHMDCRKKSVQKLEKLCNIPTKTVVLTGEKKSESYVKEFLNMQKATYFVHVGFTSGRRFSYKNQFNAEILQIDFAPWISRKYITKSSYQRVYLMGTQMKNSDVRKFINHWLAGSNPKLKNIFVQLKHDCSSESVLRGLTMVDLATNRRDLIEKTPEVTVYKFKEYIIHENRRGSLMGYHIQRSDGVIGTILFDSKQSICFNVQPEGKYFNYHLPKEKIWDFLVYQPR